MALNVLRTPRNREELREEPRRRADGNAKIAELVDRISETA